MASFTDRDSVPRPGWRGTIRNRDGVVYEQQDDPGPHGEEESYWQGDTAHLVVPYRTATKIYRQGCTIQRMLENAVDWMLDPANEWFLDRVGFGVTSAHQDPKKRERIKQRFRQLMRDTWEHMEYGRLMERADFIWDEVTQTLRFLEVNMVPVGAPESAISQMRWLEDNMERDPENYRDQFNALFDDLVKSFRHLATNIQRELGFMPVVHFFYAGSDTESEEEGGERSEDYLNTMYYANCFAAAGRRNPYDKNEPGYEYKVMGLQHINYAEGVGFYEPIPGDPDGGIPIQVAFMLYPWNWLIDEPRGEEWLAHYGLGAGKTLVLQPPWTAVLDNQALNVALWLLYGDDPELSQLLLPSFFPEEKPGWLTDWVEKPFTAHEGGGKVYYRNCQPVESCSGTFDDTGHIVQAFQKQPVVRVGSSNMKLVLSLWYCGPDATTKYAPSCLIFRATRVRPGDLGNITNRNSFILPHVINDGPAILFEGV